MDKAKGTILLFDTEPAGAVRGIRVFIHACSDLLLEQVGYFIEDAWGKGKVLVCPWDMIDNRSFDWGKVVISEPTLLHLCPC